MKNCLRCRHAMWERTKSGALHPSGEGECTWKYQAKPLAQAFYWTCGEQKPAGGRINRKRELPDHCAYYVHEATS